MTLTQNLLEEAMRLEKAMRAVQERLQAQAWVQLNAARDEYQQHRADLAEGLPDHYAAPPKPMPKNKRYLFLTKSLYVCSDGRVICSETPGQSFTEAEALEGRDPTLPPADFRLALTR